MNSRTGLGSLAALALAAILGCGDDGISPTEPAPAPTLATAAVAIPSFYQVSGGNYHTCGVTPDNRLLCWGVGILGDGAGYGYDPRSPVQVAGSHPFHQVSSGYYHTCAVTTDYRLYCWGRNYDGQIGDGTRTDRTTPVLIGGGRLFRQVEVGYSHTCAIASADGKAYCWGDNTQGKLGDGTTTARLRPVPVAGGHQFRQISAGYLNSCGIATTYKVFCWGSDQDGQVGNGPGITNRTIPTAVAGSLLFRQLDAMWDHVCGVTAARRAYCWGRNEFGQLGDGTTTSRFAPTAVAGGIVFDRVSVGGGHTCGETTQNQVYCWGANNQGQLGNGTTTRRLTPAAVAGGIFFLQVSTGSSYACGVASNAVGYCWGWNLYGQLGDGTIRNRSTPVPVRQTDKVVRLSSTLIESDDPDPSAPGTPVTVRYAVMSDSTIVDGRAPTGQVVVKSGAASCTGGLAVSSVGTVTIARGSCTLTLVSAGQVILVATYSGDATFAGSSDAESHRVQ